MLLVASLLLWNSCVCLSSHVALLFTLIFVLDKKAEEGSSSAITEETSANVQQWRRNNLSLQIPSRATNLSPEDSVVIKMPPTPSPTPRRVNFSLTMFFFCFHSFFFTFMIRVT